MLGSSSFQGHGYGQTGFPRVPVKKVFRGFR